jgi:hypothetical protein
MLISCHAQMSLSNGYDRLSHEKPSFVIGALVDIPGPGAEGVLFAMGSRFGGHALYVRDNRLHYVNSFVGAVEQKIVGTEDSPMGENLILSASFDKDGMEPDGAVGAVTLYHGDREVRVGSSLNSGRSQLLDRACISDGTAGTRHRRLPRGSAVPIHRRHDQPRRYRRQRRSLHGPRT